MNDRIAEQIEREVSQELSNAFTKSVRTDERFEETAKRYVKERGIVNALHILSEIMESLSLLEGDDFEQAATLIGDCETACDLKYPTQIDAEGCLV